MQEELESFLDEYYANNGKKLRHVVDQILKNFGGVDDSDYHDFYDVANETFVSVLKNYDNQKNDNFHAYLNGCLSNKIKTEMTRRNRKKRCNFYTNSNGEVVYLQDCSLDASLDEEGNTCLLDRLVIRDGDEENRNEHLSEQIDSFVRTLPKTQKRICAAIMSGLKPAEIKEALNISPEEFTKNMNAIRSFESVKKLMKDKNNIINESRSIEVLNNNVEKSCEKSKEIHLNVSNIIRKMQNEMIRFDYPGQRESFQWSLEMKGNLISDILQGNPLPDLVLAEEVRNEFPIIWDLDGKQRCTTIEEFKRDVFKISSKVKIRNIRYGAQKYDENGKLVHDDDGTVIREWKTFDLTNKKYSQLPDELKDKFNEYTFKAVQYINCTKDEIDYHISRYNEGKPMTSSQKGIILLGYDFASLAKSISRSKFFTECCNFGRKDAYNGTAERIVVESMMFGFFESKWHKSLTKMFEFLKQNATTEMFENFDEWVSELVPLMNDRLIEKFTSADTFIWLGTYIHFKQRGLTAEDYIEFMKRFFDEYVNVSVDGKSFEDIVNETKIKTEDKNRRGTKDVSVIEEKNNIINKLMDMHFNTSISENDNKLDDYNNKCEADELVAAFKSSDFSKAYSCTDNTELAVVAARVAKQIYPNIEKDTFEICLDVLNDWSLNVPADANMFGENTIPAFVGLATYAYDKELDVECGEYMKYIGSNWNSLTGGLNKSSIHTGDLISDFNQYLAAKTNTAMAS